MARAQVKAAIFALGGICLVAYLALLACDTNITIRQDVDSLKRPRRQGFAYWLDFGCGYFDIVFIHFAVPLVLPEGSICRRVWSPIGSYTGRSLAKS